MTITDKIIFAIKFVADVLVGILTVICIIILYMPIRLLTLISIGIYTIITEAINDQFGRIENDHNSQK